MMHTLRMVVCSACLLALPGVLAGQQAKEALRLGDVVRLDVEGDTLLTGTYTVGGGPTLIVRGIGEIPLAGVRRADLEAHLRTQLARYVKNEPVIRAKVLIRLSVVGEVTRPGVYPVPTDLVVADALMLAGGPTPLGNFAKTRIEREGSKLVDDREVQRAFARGMTVDDMNLRAGDQIFVPRAVVRDAESTWRIVGIIVGIPVAIFAITQLGK